MFLKRNENALYGKATKLPTDFQRLNGRRNPEGYYDPTLHPELKGWQLSFGPAMSDSFCFRRRSLPECFRILCTMPN